MGMFAILCAAVVAKRFNEIKRMPGFTKPEHVSLTRPHEYVNSEHLPSDFSWGNINGESYLTKALNQHLPQYCGSCWAHGSMSALADRIKIDMKKKKIASPDINLAIQNILECGAHIGGSCYGGESGGAYQFVKEQGYIPYDTCNPYLACSSDSKEGFCGYGDWGCKACRTCSTFTSMGGSCVDVGYFPNASIAEYGTVTGVDKMKAEIYTRGPIACNINADPVLNYTGGVFDGPNEDTETNHVISVVGWGEDANTPYWIIRNSWGEYWGEMGYLRLKMGENQIGIESTEQCTWATPATYTTMNYPCFEGGENCIVQQEVVDPAHLQMTIV